MRSGQIQSGSSSIVRGEATTERGMRLLLTCLIALIVITDIFDISLGLGRGLSAKNALLYLIAVALVFKMIVQQSFEFELPALHVCFVVLIAYSLLSILTAALIVQYPRYSLMGSGISLKSRLVDHAIFFAVFFYGLRESRNAHAMLKALLFAVIIGNTVAFLNAIGVLQVGDMELRKDGRMTGVMGESNQDAAFVSLFVPALAAAMMMSRGIWRTPWFAGLLVSLGVIVLTASRGAFVGLVLSGICGVMIFRRYFPIQKIAAIGSGIVAIVALVFTVMSVRYGDLLYKRVVGDSTSSDLVGASSGRLEIWSTALAAMADAPLSFLTGFGWNVYWSMPFRLSPHNHYLSLWFNVGLVGLVCGVLLLVLVVRQALAAVAVRDNQYRPVFIGFVFGVIAIGVAVFFVDLYTPWLWFWAYAGLVMRIAVNIQKEQTSSTPVEKIREPDLAQPRDAFGWVGTAR